MIVDTSAVLAILFDESDAATYARAISEADSRRMSAANFVEAANRRTQFPFAQLQ